jgi:hypothetical protein
MYDFVYAMPCAYMQETYIEQNIFLSKKKLYIEYRSNPF